MDAPLLQTHTTPLSAASASAFSSASPSAGGGAADDSRFLSGFVAAVAALHGAAPPGSPAHLAAQRHLEAVLSAAAPGSGDASASASAEHALAAARARALLSAGPAELGEAIRASCARGDAWVPPGGLAPLPPAHLVSLTRFFALHLLEHVSVRARWAALAPTDRAAVKALLLALAAHPAHGVIADQRFVREKLVAVAAAVAKREWPQRWDELFPALITRVAPLGPAQCWIALALLRAVFDGAADADLTTQRRRDLRNALAQTLPAVAAFLVHTLEAEWARGAGAHGAPKPARAVLVAALAAAGSVVEFACAAEQLLAGGLVPALWTLLQRGCTADALLDALAATAERRLLHGELRALSLRCFFQSVECLAAYATRVAAAVAGAGTGTAAVAATGAGAAAAAEDGVDEGDEDNALRRLGTVSRIAGTMGVVFAQDFRAGGALFPENSAYITLTLGFLAHPSRRLVANVLPAWLAVVRNPGLCALPDYRDALPRVLEHLLEKCTKIDPFRGGDGGNGGDLAAASRLARLEFDDRGSFMLFQGDIRSRTRDLIRAIGDFALPSLLSFLAARVCAAFDPQRQPERGSDAAAVLAHARRQESAVFAAGAALALVRAEPARADAAAVRVLEQFHAAALAFRSDDPALLANQVALIRELDLRLLAHLDPVPALLQRLFELATLVRPGESPGSVLSVETVNLRRKAIHGLVALATGAPALLRPHLESIVRTGEELASAQRLLPSERYLVLEAAVAVANDDSECGSAAGRALRASILAHAVPAAAAELRALIEASDSPLRMPALWEGPGFAALLAIRQVLSGIGGVWRRCGDTDGFPDSVLPLLEPVCTVIRDLQACWTPRIAAEATCRAVFGLSDADTARMLSAAPDAAARRPRSEVDRPMQVRAAFEDLREHGYLFVARCARVPEFFALAHVGDALNCSVFAHLECFEPQHLRFFLRFVAAALIRGCPAHLRAAVLQAPLERLFDVCFRHLDLAWRRVLSMSNAAAAAAAAVAAPAVAAPAGVRQSDREEIVHERLTRELSREVIACVELAVRAGGLPASSPSAAALASLSTGFLYWPDATCFSKAAPVCAALVPLLVPHLPRERLAAFLLEMFNAAVVALSVSQLESHHASILLLLRRLLATLRPLPEFAPAFAFLAGLPGNTPESTAAALDALDGARSEPRAQKDQLRTLFRGALDGLKPDASLIAAIPREPRRAAGNGGADRVGATSWLDTTQSFGLRQLWDRD